MSYIDFHTHIGPLWYGREPLSPVEMIGWMDQHEVEKIIVLPLESPESSSYYILTETVLGICAQFPERLIPFCVIDARMSLPDPDRTVPEIIREFVGRGARGIGEVKVGLPIDDPQLQRLYQAANELELPILLHLDSLRCTDDEHLSGLEAMLQAYPKATFIGHAPGFWSAISGDMTFAERGGYPKRPVAPGGAVERLLTQYDNLYGDLSAGSGHNAITRDPEYGRGFLERCHQQLLFATDMLMKGQETPQFEMMDQMALPPEVHHAIARGNAERLLGLA